MKQDTTNWWEVEHITDLATRLEAEGLEDEDEIAGNAKLMARRQEITRQFMDDQRRQMLRNEFIWQQEREEEILWKQQMEREAREQEREEQLRKEKRQSNKFLKETHQTKREAEPEVLDGVRAAPLTFDVTEWEAPKYEKDADENELLRNTAKKHFLFREKPEDDDESSTQLTATAGSKLNAGITPDTVSMLLDAFEPVKIDKGKAIVEEGNVDDHLYVVEKGTVEFRVNNTDKTDDDENNQSETVVVATGGAGTTFGDQNLLHSLPAERTVVATESTKVFRLNQETYRGIVQKAQVVEEAKKKKKRKKKKKQRQKEQAGREEPETLSEEKEDEEWWKDSKTAQLNLAIRDALEKVHLDDLERIKVLGEGQFGEVWLVAADLQLQLGNSDNNYGDESKSELSTHEERYEFALKLQETYDDYRYDTATSELNIMKEVSESGHPFVSMLYRSYETEESKDMLLGLIPGGELWDNIHKEDEATGEWLSGLSEGASRFYAMVVADTLDYLHSKHYVFRDLKPENIMLDGYGYPVIVDFGFCKRLPDGPDDKTYTFCGTPNYVAPEIVLNVGHNGKVDCWALGIVIYEMISGINPFYYDDMDQVELYRAICEDDGEPLSEKNHSKQVRRLIKGLMAKDPYERLGAREVLEHSWFEGLSLKLLRKRQIKAPWIPPGGEGEKADYFTDCYQSSRKREKELEERLRVVEQTVMGPAHSPIRMNKWTIEDLVKPVPKGIVSERINDSSKLNSSSQKYLSILTPTRQNMEEGIVAKRISDAKNKEKEGNVPSLFANFPRLEK